MGPGPHDTGTWDPALTKKLVRFYRELAVSDNILVMCYQYITMLLPRVLPLNTIK